MARALLLRAAKTLRLCSDDRPGCGPRGCPWGHKGFNSASGAALCGYNHRRVVVGEVQIQQTLEALCRSFVTHLVEDCPWELRSWANEAGHVLNQEGQPGPRRVIRVRAVRRPAVRYNHVTRACEQASAAGRGRLVNDEERPI